MENLYELLEEAAHKVPTKGIVIVNNSQCDLFLTYYTAYSKLCNWIDIDTINVSKASNVTIICMLKKNFIINLCCVEK